MDISNLYGYKIWNIASIFTILKLEYFGLKLSIVFNLATFGMIDKFARQFF